MIVNDVITLGSDTSEFDAELCQIDLSFRLTNNAVDAEPPSTNQKNPSKDLNTIEKRVEDEEESAEECPICFEPWTNSGPHRISSLPCGHLFGSKCIVRWLRKNNNNGSNNGDSACPTCKASVKAKDVRPLWVKRIKVMDEQERQQWVQAVKKEREARISAELAASAAQAKLLLYSAQSMQESLIGLKDNYLPNAVNTIGRGAGWIEGLRLKRKIAVVRPRLLALDSLLGCLIVGCSAPLPSESIPAGLMCISLMDAKTHPLVVNLPWVRCVTSMKVMEGSGMTAILSCEGRISVWSHEGHRKVLEREIKPPADELLWMTELIVLKRGFLLMADKKSSTLYSINLLEPDPQVVKYSHQLDSNVQFKKFAKKDKENFILTTEGRLWNLLNGQYIQQGKGPNQWTKTINPLRTKVCMFQFRLLADRQIF